MQKWYLYRFSWSTRKYVRFQISAANLPSLFLSSFLKLKTIKILPYCNKSVASIQSWSLLPLLFVFNQAFCHNFGLLGLWWVVYFFKQEKVFQRTSVEIYWYIKQGTNMKRLLKGSVSLLQLLFPPLSDVCRLQSNEVKHQWNCKIPRIPFSINEFHFHRTSEC